MVGRQKFVFTLLAAALVLAPATLQAQDMGRYRVLIPNFHPVDGANKKFGERAAKELRKLINTLATHQPIEEKEIKKNLKRLKVKMEDLDCIRTRQLAAQMDAPVALCASYTENGDQETVKDIQFWNVSAQEKFDVEPITVHKDEYKAAAQHIFDSFDRYVQQTRFAAFCVEYAQSKQWDNALRNCDQALELNPGAISVRFQRARILYEQKKYDEALAELENVLSVDQFHQDALQLAGYISALEGKDEQALEYYKKYLQLNPSNAQVRMKIAYDLAKAGDPRGAMHLIREGLDMEPDNVDLLEQYGGFAFAAALEVVQESALGAENGGGIPPEAEELYREAISAYEKVFSIKGADTPVAHLKNIIAAYIQLGELDKAIDFGQKVLETHPQEDSLWSLYADALHRAGRLDEAIAALDRVKEINPSHASASLRQGSWLIEAGQIDRAVDILSEVAEADSAQAEKAARLIFADAYQKGVQKDRYDYAVRGIAAAKRLPNLSSSMKSQLNFWQAYSLYQSAVKEQEPQTLETAKKTLPKFKQALELFQQAEEYAASQPSITLSQFLNNTNTYIEIQEAIIKRGG